MMLIRTGGSIVTRHRINFGHSCLLTSSCSSRNKNVSYKVGFMFPGQGAQAVGMGSKVCNDVPAAKVLYSRASEILGYDLFDKSVNGPKAELDSTVISQPAIFVASMACVEQLRATNPAAVESCTVAMGLSLGEYSALCFAGAISFEDGVRLTKARGEAMQAASDTVPSSMVAISGLDALKVQEICDAAARETGRPLCIANYLAEGSYAVSGAKEACLAAIEIATVMGARQVVQLAVAGAFHTAFMQPAVLPLQEALRHVTVSSPRIPVIANVDGKAHFYPQDIRDSLVRQVTSPVQWETTIGTMVRSPDFVKAYELGPGTVCKALVKRFGRRIDVTSVSP